MALTKLYQTNVLEAGCDEAGRGCLAGPVYAAAVILDKHKRIKYLDDSKKLTHKQREELRFEIEEKALAWAVASFTNEQIEEINILKDSFLSMNKAIDNLTIKPQHLIIDGNRFIPYSNLTHTCIVKGDAKFQSIAAASILAKTHRDELMLQYHEEFPNYAWDQNKGYGTLKHRAAIEKHGITPYHRKTFRLLKEQLELF